MLERVEREVVSLRASVALWDVALHRRAENENVAAQVSGGAGEFGEIQAGTPAHRGISGGEVESLSLGKQPVQADDLHAGRLGLAAQLSAARRGHVRDARREREGSHFEARVAE